MHYQLVNFGTNLANLVLQRALYLRKTLETRLSGRFRLFYIDLDLIQISHTRAYRVSISAEFFHQPRLFLVNTLQHCFLPDFRLGKIDCPSALPRVLFEKLRPKKCPRNHLINVINTWIVALPVPSNQMTDVLFHKSVELAFSQAWFFRRRELAKYLNQKVLHLLDQIKLCLRPVLLLPE